jgi:ribose transport system substrate-binding protein
MSSPTPQPGRRRDLWRLATWLVLGLALPLTVAQGVERRYTVAFANLTEEPGVTLEGTGFTGRDVSESLRLAARRLPIDLVFYDNQRDGARALANVADAIARKVDLYIQYHQDPAVNQTVAEKLRAVGTPLLAVNHPVPGAPLYTADNLAAGRIAGDALGEFGSRAWRGHAATAIVLGHLEDRAGRVPERAQGVAEGLRRHLPAIPIVPLDTQGNPARVGPLLGKALAARPTTKLLIATMDDATALAAKAALESAGRMPDVAIASHGADRSVHGGVNDRKEIDPNNRGSVVIGSVAFYLDRYGYDLLPLALALLRGEPVAPRTVTAHRLLTPANIWREYPPYDMN